MENGVSIGILHIRIRSFRQKQVKNVFLIQHGSKAKRVLPIVAPALIIGAYAHGWVLIEKRLSAIILLVIRRKKAATTALVKIGTVRQKKFHHIWVFIHDCQM